MANVVNLSVEIEIPEDISDEMQDTLIEDLIYEQHVERLKLMVKKWARSITGENCHIAVTVD